jgi:hypothetical protein
MTTCERCGAQVREIEIEIDGLVIESTAYHGLCLSPEQKIAIARRMEENRIHETFQASLAHKDDWWMREAGVAV